MELPINQIIQGDCLEVLRRLPDESIDLVVTSPPYNKHSANRETYKTDSWTKARIDYEVFKDDIPEEDYQNQQKTLLNELLRIIKSNGSIFYNHKNRVVNHAIISPEKWLGDFIIRQVIIWDRFGSPQLEPIRFLPCYEQIYWITKNRATPWFNPASFYDKEIWRISPEQSEHPAPFPEELAGKCIRAASPNGGIVLDPYMGSGTTAVAAKILKRNWLGIELNPEYIKMAEKRLRAINTIL